MTAKEAVMYFPLVTPDRTPMPDVPDERKPVPVLGSYPLTPIVPPKLAHSLRGMNDDQRAHQFEMDALKEKEELAEKTPAAYDKLKAEKDFYKLRSESMRDVLAMLYQEIDDLKRVIGVLERPKTEQQERQAAYDEYCRIYGLKPGAWNG